MPLTPATAAAGAFIAVMAVICGMYWTLVVMPERRFRAALTDRLKLEASVSGRASVALLRKDTTFTAIPAVDRLLARYGTGIAPLKRLLLESGVPLSAAGLLQVSALAAIVGGVVARLYFHVWWLTLAAALVAGFIPIVVVRAMRRRRINQFEAQFPEAIELIARALRAGHAFASGLKMAADELPGPTGPEFRLLFERQNFGAHLPAALKTFAERIPSLDARFFVTAVLTQREAGGNLSEVLDRLAAVMRERFRIKREVRVKSAHGRMTATVLAGMPPVLAALMFVNNPDDIRQMFTDPLGMKLLMAGAVLEMIGIVIIRRIVNIEY